MLCYFGEGHEEDIFSDSGGYAGSDSGGGLRAGALEAQSEVLPRAQAYESAVDIFLSYQPAIIRKVLESYILTALNQINRFIPSILKVIPSSILFLLRPMLNVAASITGMLFSIPASCALYIPRAIGIPVTSIFIDPVVMLFSSIFDPLIRGLATQFLSIERVSEAVQELLVSPVLPAITLTGFVESLLYGDPLSSLISLCLFPLRIPEYCLAIPLWPLKAIAVAVEICAIGIMLPVRLLLIPVLITLNLSAYPFRVVGYWGSSATLYALDLICPPEIRNAILDLTTLPSRISSLPGELLYRLLVLPLQFIVGLLRSIPYVREYVA